MRVIQVYEFQKIYIHDVFGDTRFTPKDHAALAAFAKQHQQQYYQLIHRGIRFLNYVGALQLGNLLIEILPKTDKASGLDTWRNSLIDMLNYCQLLKVDQVFKAHLQHRPYSILDIYYSLFIEEVEKLLKIGLQKSYSSVQQNTNSIRGQLLFHRQIQENYIHKERFYTQFQKYQYDNPANQIIVAALHLLARLPLAADLSSRLRTIQAYFPKVQHKTITEKDFHRLQLHRTATHYQPAVNIAELLLRCFRPGLQAGDRPLIALLFNMNTLFEEYVFRQLQTLKHLGLQVLRQQSKPFWNRRSVRPDILLKMNGQQVVIDTKWKLLSNARASMRDLQQAFVYAQYFKASSVMLLYPKNQPHLNDLSPT
ncbi:MAG: restriction endonuclease, partial [Bacteroidota bacterium]